MKGEPTIHRRVLDYAYLGTDALYQDFHLSAQGYCEEEAEESRARYGGNVLSGRAADTVWYRLRRAFITPFTIILFVLASISFVTDFLLASNFSRNMTTVLTVYSGNAGEAGGGSSDRDDCVQCMGASQRNMDWDLLDGAGSRRFDSPVCR